MMDKSIPEITLNDGLTLPVIGLGTYKLRGTIYINIQYLYNYELIGPFNIDLFFMEEKKFIKKGYFIKVASFKN